MRRLFLLGTLLAPITLMGVPAQAANQDFTLVNRTGYQIDDVYVSPSASNNWGNEIMGNNRVLTDGDSVAITFTAPGNVCNWDMKVKYNDGDEATWQTLNLCQISKVTLFYNRRQNTTRAQTE